MAECFFTSKGIGTLLLGSIEKYVKESISNNLAVSLELLSSKEVVYFYKKAGFEEYPCNWGEPVMFKMIR